jgi:LPS sulfotransferase NodH
MLFYQYFFREAVMQPRHSYLVCATPRSGSTLFCEVLSNTNIAGRPKEHFEMLKDTGLPKQPQQYFETVAEAKTSILQTLGNPPPLKVDSVWLAQQDGSGYTHYLAQVLEAGTTPNGVFGAKMMWGYFDDFIHFVRQLPAYTELGLHEILTSMFPNLQYIWVKRRDKVRQAVSLWKAIQTQSWREDQCEEEPIQLTRKPVFHFAAIKHLERQLIEYEVAWQQYFAAYGVQPLVVVYEELLNHFEATIRQALQYLSIPVPEHLTLTMPSMQRQADAQSEEWVQQYCLIKEE